jgi:2-succinyl-5-enolpyruvyl-6-hydroxy-3-cyclohexene-1-carboxylate synthase
MPALPTEPVPTERSPNEPSPADVAATFCATLVDEWARLGLTHAVVCPGSRSTPMALALAHDDRISVSIHHDERSAAFVAVGLGRATRRPALILTTSGTAAVELHPGVVEAHHARVPLIALTADRPPELHGIGAPQTIDQRHLYGASVRAFLDPGVASWEQRSTWRSLARAAFDGATGIPRGPIQLNLAFREPLLGQARELPPVDGAIEGAIDVDRSTPLPPAGDAVTEIRQMVADADGRIVVLAGESTTDPATVMALADLLGAPVLADPRSGCAGDAVVAHADALVRAPRWSAAHAPSLVVRVGDLPASKELGRWLERHPCPHLLVDPDQLGVDPRGEASLTIHASVAALLAVLDGPADGPLTSGPSTSVAGWREAWQRADSLASTVITGACDSDAELTEPSVARTVASSVSAGASIVVSSSMPVRDLEWFATRRANVDIISNRGTNGIDGVISTALGVALSGRRTVAIVGDVAYVHDSSALIALARRGVDLTIVVIDNDGGGIFSFLPQANALPAGDFELLFGTPHQTDLLALAAAHGIHGGCAVTRSELTEALQGAGVSIVMIRTDRSANVEIHRLLNVAIVELLDRS